MAASHAINSICEPGLRIEAIEFGALQHGVENGGALAAGFGSEEQEVRPGDGNRPVILLKWAMRSTSTIAGSLSMATASGTIAASGAKPAKLSTSRRRPAWFWWSRRGCWIT